MTSDSPAPRPERSCGRPKVAFNRAAQRIRQKFSVTVPTNCSRWLTSSAQPGWAVELPAVRQLAGCVDLRPSPRCAIHLSRRNSRGEAQRIHRLRHAAHAGSAVLLEPGAHDAGLPPSPRSGKPGTTGGGGDGGVPGCSTAGLPAARARSDSQDVTARMLPTQNARTRRIAGVDAPENDRLPRWGSRNVSPAAR
jgi:hypothetical protein